MLPLEGVRVVEMAGLAPAPFAGMLLADFGASVVRVEKPAAFNADVLTRGKRSLAVDIKSADGVALVRRLVQQADVLIEPFRPGVMERLGLGPDTLLGDNPRLIYARLSGFGQQGEHAAQAGHDINYLAMAGVLSVGGCEFRQNNEAPRFPVNLLADFGGGGMFCVVGILMTLLHRHRTSRGQVVDVSITEGAGYLGNFIRRMKAAGGPIALLRGDAPFYTVYRTKDDRYMSVGALEPQFYEQLLHGLALDPGQLPDRQDPQHWPQLRAVFAACFASKTLDEWSRVFEHSDACVFPVLALEQAPMPPQRTPRLSLAPEIADRPDDDMLLVPGQHSTAVLRDYGWSEADIRQLIARKTIHQAAGAKRHASHL
ncbi:alpha-methylacyl-CoA racemase [Syncephalis pseudoplumigaleata]|uniref:Alpha-methylacyl-CoA racemase n=1 Tax=Syncephalis pseudoplumigaleata TaxID=1712513 RepID=A0A4P9YZB5_9FUNG|nr:alpha-methylacyl-CoA racemase [Syncephalis pseudoplumigaleata]|eukprot:RKP24370.1 alpha-methylacyl-CoA racemase [Syncephalis pseudoplumigaleata]